MFDSILLCSILFLLPTQLGLHFWPTFSYVGGFRIDYLSPTIYSIDLLIVLYLILNLSQLIRLIVKNYKSLVFVLLVVFLNLLFSISPYNTSVWFTHLLLYLSFVVIIKNKNIKLEVILRPILVSCVFLILLEIIQIGIQGSIGGLMYWFGERSFNTGTPNIAKISLYGREYIRPYATFSHPNSLAGFLFLVLILVKKNNKYKIFTPILILGILLTLSKSVTISMLMVYLQIPLSILTIAIAILIIIPLLPITDLFVSFPKYIIDRLRYGVVAGEIIKKFPIFGIGYGNYLLSLPLVLPTRYFLVSNFQPIHNFILLTVSEFGLINIISLIGLYGKYIYKKIKKENIYYLVLILFLSTFDHYLYTLPQNKLLLLISLAYLV